MIDKLLEIANEVYLAMGQAFLALSEKSSYRMSEAARMLEWCAMRLRELADSIEKK